MKKKIAIFISGRGSNMKAIVEQCHQGILKDLADVQLVFANKEDAAGLEYAKSMGVKTGWIASKGQKRSDFDQKVIDYLSGFHLDYIILAGYMRVLSAGFVKAYAGKIINIHPADTKEHPYTAQSPTPARRKRDLPGQSSRTKPEHTATTCPPQTGLSHSATSRWT